MANVSVNLKSTKAQTNYRESQKSQTLGFNVHKVTAVSICVGSNQPLPGLNMVRLAIFPIAFKSVYFLSYAIHKAVKFQSLCLFDMWRNLVAKYIL